MIKLAICDDEPVFLNQAERIIQEFNQSRKSEYNFKTVLYSSPRVLWDDISDGERFDVYVLDVEMDEVDGITLSEKIRSIVPNPILVFLSSHTEFPIVRESFKVNALRYVSKIFIENSLPEALSAALEELHKRESSCYLLTYYSNVTRIPYDDIVYVHRVKRMTEIVTVNYGNPQIKKTLSDLFDELQSDRFIFVDKGCFVNADHIIKISDSIIVLRNGERIAVSRKKLPIVKSTLIHLWGGV